MMVINPLLILSTIDISYQYLKSNSTSLNQNKQYNQTSSIFTVKIVLQFMVSFSVVLIIFRFIRFKLGISV
ncbi:unnamed protein product [Paramecium sonneborni]|uniref:Uncharacterized protein n=1 Tax=Paramecium sonneborni TaxID=65129 RepID=A0A8S1LVX5_9CILI|nr:unnamed protein product [Paramecium sonneborni]